MIFAVEQYDLGFVWRQRAAESLGAFDTSKTAANDNNPFLLHDENTFPVWDSSTEGRASAFPVNQAIEKANDEDDHESEEREPGIHQDGAPTKGGDPDGQHHRKSNGARKIDEIWAACFANQAMNPGERRTGRPS